MTKILSPIAGNVWKVKVSVGTVVAEGDVLIILESMKMEVPIETEAAGTVVEVVVTEGASITENAVLVVID
jgi:acetyl-CoA carboxylase biotin carboxyl carrier protein